MSDSRLEPCASTADPIRVDSISANTKFGLLDFICKLKLTPGVAWFEAWDIPLSILIYGPELRAWCAKNHSFKNETQIL